MRGAGYVEERGDAGEAKRLAEAAANLLYSGSEMGVNASELHFGG
jgi:hypothetical protein